MAKTLDGHIAFGDVAYAETLGAIGNSVSAFAV
jgi:hypothetical protein